MIIPPICATWFSLISIFGSGSVAAGGEVGSHLACPLTELWLASIDGNGQWSVFSALLSRHVDSPKHGGSKPIKSQVD